MDCGKLIWNHKERKRCHSCAQKYVSQNPENHPTFKHGKTLIQAYCKCCGLKLAKLAFLHNTIFCIKCANKRKVTKITGSGNPNYKDGRSLVTNYCSDCNKEISWKAEQCAGCANIGKNNPNFKGGITPLEQAIRLLRNYRNWRDEVFKRDNYICQDCKYNSNRLEVHHIKFFAKLFSEFLQAYNQFSPIEDKETLIRLAINWKPFWEANNGKTLCEKCHKKYKIQAKGGINQ